MGSISYTVTKQELHDMLALVGHHYAGMSFNVVVSASDKRETIDVVVSWPADQVVPLATGTSPLHDALRAAVVNEAKLAAQLESVTLDRDAVTEANAAMAAWMVASSDRAAAAEAERDKQRSAALTAQHELSVQRRRADVAETQRDVLQTELGELRPLLAEQKSQKRVGP